MTVSDLRKYLEHLDDDLKILVSHDPEGNSFSELFQVERCDVESLGEQLDDQLMADIGKAKSEVLLLWPTS